MGDLPVNIRKMFNDVFLPYLIEWAGTQHPWHQQTDEEVMAVWKRVLPDESTLDNDVQVSIAKLVSVSAVSLIYT